MRQVTHALLTRPPLSHQTLHPEGIEVRCFVRLACVKHAASVHPEPGSNSQKKVYPFRTKSLAFLFPKFIYYCYGCIFSDAVRLLLFYNQKKNLFSEFSRLFHCSVINVLRFQTLVPLSATFSSLSHLSMYVNIFFKNFFIFFIFYIFHLLRY